MTTSSKEDIIIFDGGTGREIERCGGPFRQPEWSALALYEDPAIVQQVHEAFLEAGATHITTNSYAIVPFHLGNRKFLRDKDQLLDLAVKLAQQARDSYVTKHPDKNIQILGSIPPICGSYEPEAFSEDKARLILSEFLNHFCGNDFYKMYATVDILLFETVGSLREARYYLQTIQQHFQRGKNARTQPIWLSFCVKTEKGEHQTPTLLSGEQISEAIEALHKEGLLAEVSVIMVNCCDLRLVKDSLLEIRSTLRQHFPDSGIRTGAYPNAFSIPPPDAANQTLRQVDYNILPEVMKCHTLEWIRDCGATVIGGCCGVNPDHIRAMASLICQPVSSSDIQQAPEEAGMTNGAEEIQSDKKPTASDNTLQNTLLPQQPRRIATNSTVFVTGLAPAVTRLHVEKMFAKFGQVLRVNMKTSAKTGATFCFCELDSVENAQKAMDNLNGRMLLHKRLVVQPANDQRESGQPTTVPTHADPARESKSIDKKIKLLKQKIGSAKGEQS